MDMNSIYAIGLLGVPCALLLYQVGAWIIRQSRQPMSELMRRHVLMPRLIPGRHILNPTRAASACFLAYWGTMCFYNLFRVSSLVEAAKRAGQIAVINLIPLMLGTQLACIAHLLGLSLGTFTHVHVHLGLMVTLQGFLHGGLHVFHLEGPSALQTSVDVAAVSLAVVVVAVFAKRYLFEVFLGVHSVATIVFAIALWMHLDASSSLSRLLLMVGGSTHVGTWLLRLLWQICYNVESSKNRPHLARLTRISHPKRLPNNTSQAEAGGEASQADESLIFLEIRPARVWDVQPGQYVYLTLFTWRYLSFLQRHPFVLTWWEGSSEDDKAEILHIAVQARRGWTRYLRLHQESVLGCAVWLDGPFGTSFRNGTADLNKFDTVLLFATGVGIFGVMPLLRSLVARNDRQVLKTRRIKIVWDTLSIPDKVSEWIEPILERSDLPENLLSVSVHLPRGHTSDESSILHCGTRLKYIYDVPNISEYVGLETGHKGQRGYLKKDIVAIISAHDGMRHDLRVATMEDKNNSVRLFELDFQPQSTRRRASGLAM